MSFLPLALLSIAAASQSSEATYVRDFSKPAPLLPQTQPFIQYTRPAYDFNLSTEEADLLGIDGKRPKQWWDGQIKGKNVGGPILSEVAPFGRGANLLRAAYGMRAWGITVDDKGWVEKADRMAHLFLVHASEQSTPVGFNFRTKQVVTGSMEQGGYVSTYWLNRWIESYPDVDFAAEAKAWINISVGRALAQQKATPDSALLLAKASKYLTIEQAARARLQINSVLEGAAAGAPETIRLAGAVSQMANANEFASHLRRIAAAIPTTESGVRNGVILDGYVYANGSADLWQDAALGTLELGAYLDDRTTFEKGSKMVRATLTDYSTPFLVSNGLLSPRNLPDGRTASGDFCRSFAPQSLGFTDGEGHTLATLAISRLQFGSVYYGSNWGVGIDGILLVNGTPYSGLSINPTSYDSNFPALQMKKGDARPTRIDQPALMPVLREIYVEYRDNQAVIVARPNPIQRTTSEAPSGVFILADGTRLEANIGQNGFEAPVIASDLIGDISFEGKIGSHLVKAKGARVTLSPEFNSADHWTARGSVNDFTNGSVVSTQLRPTAWGEIHSEIIAGPHRSISFEWLGEGDVSVELWDVDLVERVRSANHPTAKKAGMTFNLDGLANRRLQIRIIDNDPKGWVSVQNIKLR